MWMIALPGRLAGLLAIGLAASLCGCASLPRSGPTKGEIFKSANSTGTAAPIRVVHVETAGDIPVSATRSPTIATLPLADTLPTDRIGPGDVLEIYIYEAGVSLFQGSAIAPGALPLGPGVKVERLPPSRVNDDGDIAIPYAGRLHVGGRTVSEIQAMVRRALRRLSQSPQVLVTVRDVINNSVIVGGEVTRPGRLVLQTNRESLSDVIALAGGYRGNVKDLSLRLARGGRTVDVRLGELVDNPALDVRVMPGDRLTVLSDPRSFSVLGASGRVDQVNFNKSAVSLVEAVSIAGGVNPNLGDPAAIFLFRYTVDEAGQRVPVVFHFDMTKTQSFFLAQQITMVDKDVLYVGNASANQPTKLIQLISQLFTPIISVTSAVQTVR